MDRLTAPTLRLTHGWRRTFRGSSTAALDPMLGVYLSDLVRPYGVRLREDMLRDGHGQSYGEMAAALLRDELPEDQPVDLLVFAFAMPDVVPGRATACYLSHVCPGSPMALALCDAGAAAAFTGLRLMSQYARAGDCRRALLVVAEQSALHYDGPPGAGASARAKGRANGQPPADSQARADGQAHTDGQAGADGQAHTDGQAGTDGQPRADRQAHSDGQAGADGQPRADRQAHSDGQAGADGQARADGHARAGRQAYGDGLARAPVPSLNTVVALMCESVDAAGRGSGRAGDNAGGARLAAVRQHAGVTPAGLDGLLAGELAALAAGRPGATLILGGVPAAGGQLPPVVPPGVARVILAPPEQPYTGLWWELAGGLAGWSAEGRQVLLAGYDEALGYLSLAAFEAGPS